MEVKVIIDIFVRYIVPIIALSISIVSFLQSRKVSKVQLRLSELEEKLKRYELEEKERKLAESSKAIVEARIYNISKGKYKMKIWNSGQAIAYNINFSVPDELNGVVFRDKVPFEMLEPGKNFEEHIIVHTGVPHKFWLKTVWEDSDGKYFEKEQIVTI